MLLEFGESKPCPGNPNKRGKVLVPDAKTPTEETEEHRKEPSSMRTYSEGKQGGPVVPTSVRGISTNVCLTRGHMHISAVGILQTAEQPLSQVQTLLQSSLSCRTGSTLFPAQFLLWLEPSGYLSTRRGLLGNV